MQNSTLFLIQAPFSQMDKTWQELSDMANADDSIVIMGDAILQINTSIINRCAGLHCLSNEHSLLADQFKAAVKILDYAQFADLVVQFERCVTLK